MRIIRASDQSFVPAAHEDPKNPGVRKRVLAQRDELMVGRVQMINWARLPGHSTFRSHYHEDMEEVFIILDGQVVMQVDGQEHRLGPGDTIFIAPREVHLMANLTGSDVNYLVVGIAGGQNGKTVVV